MTQEPRLYGQDSGSLPNIVYYFKRTPEIDDDATREKGMTVFRDVDICYYTVKGTTRTNSVKVERLKKTMPDIWHVVEPAYQRWLDGKEPLTSGTPLATIPGIGPAFVETAAMLSIRTVEDMAKATDADLERLGMGASQYRAMARDMLKAAQDVGIVAAEVAVLKEQLLANQSELKELQEANRELNKQLASKNKDDAK